MKAGIGIGLQNAAVMGGMPLGMIAAAIDLRRNTRRWWIAASSRT
jgi:hypothetical protein